MKIVFIFLWIGTLSMLASETYSQNSIIQISDYQNITIEKLIQEVESQTNYLFVYSKNEINTDERISLSAQEVTVKNALDHLAADAKISYMYDNDYIVLTKRELTQTETTTTMMQSIVITGTVVDTDNQPLPGVTILIKGTSQGTATNSNGTFSLQVANENTTLVFSYIGFGTQEQLVGNRRVINVTLGEDTREMEEVVVIGYGVQRKSDLTGSIASVSTGQLTQKPVSTVVEGLQGRVPGVQITMPNGSPNAAPVVRIRGTNSINYGNEPLYVVDGYPVGVGSSLSFINPNHVESMTVLKDASATAIYGARGANGVILITTKKGTSGATKVNYETYFGTQSVTKKIELLNAKEYATMDRLFWTRFRNGSLLSRAFPQSEIDAMGEGTDWQDEIFRTAPVQSHNLSITGGNEKTRFSIAGNYFDQDGIVINSNYSKGTIGVNLDHKANDRLEFGTNINASYQYNKAIRHNVADFNDGGVIFGALTYCPVLPVKYEDGRYSSHEDLWLGRGIYAQPNMQNPVEVAYRQQSNSNSTRILGNFFMTYRLIDGLTAKISLGADMSYRRENGYVPSDFISQKSTRGTATVSTSQSINWVNENTLTYNKVFAEKHAVTLLGGFTAQREMNESVSASNRDFFSDFTGYYNLALGTQPAIPSTGYSQWSLASFLGRLNYVYDNKYLLTASARYDGSSRFGANNRFAFFPSAALAWRVSQEDFLKDSGWLSDLKLRTSYGQTGNQEIPLYQDVQTYARGGAYVIGNNVVTSIVPGAIVNPDLKWETTSQYDAGLDISLFDNQLGFTVDYYYKKTTDLLFGVAIARQGGYTSSLQNIGSVQNKGMEFGVNTLIKRGDFEWIANANISFNRNKVLQLADADFMWGPYISGLISRNNGSATVIKTGEPIGVFWGNIFDGIWQTQDELDAGHMKGLYEKGPGFDNYRDVDGNGKFEEGLDETVVGNPHPDYEFGFYNSFRYKNFDLNFFINGVVGNDVLNINMIDLVTQINGNGNASARYREAWDGPGTSNWMAKIDRGDVTVNNYRVCTKYIEDGTFVRLRNITLGYSIPFKKNFPVQVRVYVAGENLVTLTNYSGYNPEVSAMGSNSTAFGIDKGCYPLAKMYRFGVQLGF